MVESQQQQQQSSSDSNNRRPMLWTHVVKSRKKGKNQKEQIVSFNPTLITRPVTEAESTQNALNGATPPAPMAVIRPFIKGMEQDSILIDLTTIKDRSLLNKELQLLLPVSASQAYHQPYRVALPPAEKQKKSNKKPVVLTNE
ncbi:hypothetical protein BD408DRAFT_428071 [Parasitella parasitica]|nr:hypothetical protein BD408DRAFT_428071 [Parasitella parasitica]